MAKERLVVFCGAGFSVDVGIPVMADFADELRTSEYLGDAQAEFDRIQLACDSMGFFIGGSARNLEHLASFLHILSLINPDLKFKGCDRHEKPKDALRLVTRCIRHLSKPQLDSETIKRSDRFLKSVAEVDLAVITTNYDLHLELSGYRNDRKARPTDGVLSACLTTQPKKHASVYAHDEDRSFDMFKLHGSVNWFRNEQGFTVEDRLKAVADGREDPPGVPIATVGYDDEQCPDENDCRIVPPTVIKPELDTILQQQWQGAAQAISQADRLWFIGYSFPETDSFMRYFLASALFENVKLKQVVIIDPDIDMIRTRARPMFDSPRLRYVFRWFPFPWQTLAIGALISPILDPETAAHDSLYERLATRLEHDQLKRGRLPTGVRGADQGFSMSLLGF